MSMRMSQLALAMGLVSPPAAAAVPGALARARVRTPLLLSGGAASSPDGDVPFRVAYDANSEPEDDENYEVDNLLFVGMVRTMRDGDSLLSTPVLLGMAAGMLKVLLTVAFVFRFYVEPMNDMGHWGQLLSKCPSWHDMAGLVSSLIAAPAYLLHRLSTTSEFKDSAVMWATLQKLNEQHDRKALHIMWSIVHVVRTYIKLPLFILANAGLIAFKANDVASGGSFTSLLSDTFAAGLVLEIDTYFYGLYKQFGGKIAPRHACVRLGAQTQALCDRVVKSVVMSLGIAQLALVVLMKTNLNTGFRLCAVLPLLALALIRAYGRFPTKPRSNSD